MAGLFTVDDEDLILTSPDRRKSFVHVIHGNKCEVIMDYSVRIEHIVSGATELAYELESQCSLP
ncbi:MAG: hypothetical protein K2P78_04560 [Gemmataceae bacterium]|nr:hypothetical protein [Gemmataceae bacterium]